MLIILISHIKCMFASWNKELVGKAAKLDNYDTVLSLSGPTGHHQYFFLLNFYQMMAWTDSILFFISS